jgi:hypothetical protein
MTSEIFVYAYNRHTVEERRKTRRKEEREKEKI